MPAGASWLFLLRRTGWRRLRPAGSGNIRLEGFAEIDPTIAISIQSLKVFRRSRKLVAVEVAVGIAVRPVEPDRSAIAKNLLFVGGRKRAALEHDQRRQRKIFGVQSSVFIRQLLDDVRNRV